MKGLTTPASTVCAGWFVAVGLGLALAAGVSPAVAQNPPGSAAQTSPGSVAQSSTTGAPQTPPLKSTPRPGDLEPGVNTSAIQPSPEPAGTSISGRTPNDVSLPKPDKTGAPAKQETPAKPSASATGGPESSVTGRTNSAPKSGAAAGKAHDSIQLDTTQITGNRELPKVLYIVPWKRSDLGDLVGKPVNSLLDEVLAPVDRDVFKRQNRYYDALKPDAAKDAAGSAAQGPDVKH